MYQQWYRDRKLYDFTDRGGCGAAIMRRGSPIRTLIREWNYVLCGCCLCCNSSGLFDELVTRSEDSYLVRLCLTVCDLGTSTNSHPSPQSGCRTTERKWYKVYLRTLELQSASSSRFLTVRLFRSRGILIGTFQNTLFVSTATNFPRKPWQALDISFRLILWKLCRN